MTTILGFALFLYLSLIGILTATVKQTLGVTLSIVFLSFSLCGLLAEFGMWMELR